jgi:NTE family protein
MHPALVVSGGGTKGAFEVGVLEYLNRNADFFPSIMTGTSAGSMICAPLAQAANAQEFQELVGVVRNNCLAITDMASLFGRQPWLEDVSETPMGDFIDELISVRTRPPLAPDPEGIDDSLNGKAAPRKHRSLFAIGSAIGKSSALVKDGKYLHDLPAAIMNLDPLEASLRGQSEGGMSSVDENRIAASGIKLRITVTSLSDGVGRYVTEDGSMVGEDAVTPYEGGGKPGVIEGVCASGSVPIVFPPRRIGDSIYVDGGIVQNTPLSAAVNCGAKDVIVLTASPRSMARDEKDYTQTSFLSIYARAAQETTAQELERINLLYPLVAGSTLTIVEPTVDLLGMFEVEAGLLEIDFDYGWLRAAEAFGELGQEDIQLLRGASDTIVQQRERAWFAEERILEDGPESDLVGALRRSRGQVVEAVTIWQSRGLPQTKNMDQWGHAWESHDQEIPDALKDIVVI